MILAPTEYVNLRPRKTFIHVSASQAKNFLSCERKWFYESILGIRPPPSKAQEIGIALHKELEEYFRFQKDWSELSRLAQLGLPHLPERGPLLLVEQALEEPRLAAADVRWVGYADLVDPREGKLAVVDHKTTSDLAWMMTPEDLSRDVQMVAYAQWAVGRFGPPRSGHVEVKHVYYRTRSGAAAVPVRSRIEVDTLPSLWENLNTVVSRMKTVAVSDTVEEVQPNWKSCDKFGGCPHRAVCPGSSAERRLEMAFLSEKFLSKDQINGSTPAPPAPPAPSAPPIAVAQAAANTLFGGAVGVVPPDAPPPLAVLEIPQIGADEPVKRKRGRPRKNLVPETATVVPGATQTAGGVALTNSGPSQVHVEKASAQVPANIAGVLLTTEGFDLYIDCAPLKGVEKMTLLEEHIERLGEKIAKACQVPHFTMVEFGKWKGYLVAAVLGELPQGKVFARSSETSFLVIEVLIPRARMVVRGVR